LGNDRIGIMSKESSFEEKLEQLNGLIADIEAGKDGLNSSIEKYAQAKKLADELSEMLSGAKESLGLEEEEISTDEDEEE
jgi:exodeoxyribonuclease VII small subunit